MSTDIFTHPKWLELLQRHPEWDVTITRAHMRETEDGPVWWQVLVEKNFHHPAWYGIGIAALEHYADVVTTHSSGYIDFAIGGQMYTATLAEALRIAFESAP